MHIIIPARYGSTRLPGKLLLELAGKPIIQHVYERAREAGAESVTIATDDERIAQAAKRFTAPVCMTAASHRSGTERLAEAIAQLGLPAEAIVVNLQGDEPQMPPAVIRAVAERLATDATVQVATAACELKDERQFRDPNVVKVVCDRRGRALYFSRAPVPWPREESAAPPQRHIGLYAYRAGFVREYLELAPSPLESIEQLEQLRVLWHGYAIGVHRVPAEVTVPDRSIDTLEDYEAARVTFS